MPITQGSGNPDWTRDEILLALDLLYQHGKPIDRHHAGVIELSNLLRKSTLHARQKRRENFRNPDGVALKMQNLLSALEPGRGLSFSNGDREAVETYPRDRRIELSKVATALRLAISNQTDSDEIVGSSYSFDADEMFAEGWQLTARHRFRDRRLRKRLLSCRDDNSLFCEMCNFVPPRFERSLRESFFEAHHSLPLAKAEAMRLTKIADMALLCAGCHRFVHKLISSEKRWIDIQEATKRLNSADF